MEKKKKKELKELFCNKLKWEFISFLIILVIFVVTTVIDFIKSLF